MRRNIEIIAEIAQGFEGDAKLSELLVKGAVEANADAVKFQLVYADELATPDYEYYDLFKNLEMKESVWQGLCTYIHNSGKKVYFDVFGIDSLDMALKIGADGVKISTTEFYNKRLFDAAITRFNTVFLSVGGIPVDDLDHKLSKLNSSEIDKICLMYGFQSEPTPLESNNLIKLRLFRDRYPSFKIGFMDHSDGGLDDAFYLPLVSLGMEVDVIEKHITLDRALEIEDYISGLTPSDFLKFTKLIDRFEPVIGEPTLKLSPQEEEYRAKATKSVIAIRDLDAGEVITENDIALKRSSVPISNDSIFEIDDVLGKSLKLNVAIHKPILKSNI